MAIYVYVLEYGKWKQKPKVLCFLRRSCKHDQMGFDFGHLFCRNAADCFHFGGRRGAQRQLIGLDFYGQCHMSRFCCLQLQFHMCKYVFPSNPKYCPLFSYCFTFLAYLTTNSVVVKLIAFDIAQNIKWIKDSYSVQSQNYLTQHMSSVLFFNYFAGKYQTSKATNFKMLD